MNEFLDKWAAEAERIYRDRTAGDFTFLGYLVTMLREAQNEGHITIEREF